MAANPESITPDRVWEQCFSGYKTLPVWKQLKLRLQKEGWPKHQWLDVNQAVNGALAYARQRDTCPDVTNEIIVTLEMWPQRLRISIHDSGQEYDSRTLDDPVTKRLMERFMDKWNVEEGWIRIVKKRSPSG